MENWTTNDVMYLNKYGLLTTCRAMYLVNLSKARQRKKNKSVGASPRMDSSGGFVDSVLWRSRGRSKRWKARRRKKSG